MRIISLNVSEIIEVKHKGKLVKTAIYKQPTTRRIMLGVLGFEGDDQADKRHHGGPTQAAYAFSAEEYAYWRTELGRFDLSYGLFGENMTVEGLDDSKVCIGDIYLVGGARVQVTFPRLPCSTLAMAVADPGIVKGFLKRKRVGPYFAVLGAGEVGVADEITLETAQSDRVSIVELMYLLHDAPGSQKDRERWHAAASIDALDVRVKTKLLVKLEGRAKE